MPISQNKDDDQLRLMRMNESIENGYRTVLETEETSHLILENLHSQRETIQQSIERLKGSNANLGKSSRTARAMTRHLIINRLMLVGACAFLFIITLGVLFFFLKHKYNF